MTFQNGYFRKGQFRERKEKQFLGATFLASRHIYFIHLYFYVEFYFRDKNALYTVSVHVLSSGFCIKGILQLNTHLLADRTEAFYLRITRSLSHRKYLMARIGKEVLFFCLKK